jgi:hypothetical protein
MQTFNYITSLRFSNQVNFVEDTMQCQYCEIVFNDNYMQPGDTWIVMQTYELQ